MTMTTLSIPFKYDYVGSFLRPEAVQNAKQLFKKGLISKDELKAVEDAEIVKLIEKQKAAGYHVITDGEYRRSYWHLDFFWGLNGIEQTELSHGYFFHGEETAKGSIKITGKISGENHPFVEHFKFVNQFADDNTVAKQTFPAPAQLHRLSDRRGAYRAALRIRHHQLPARLALRCGARCSDLRRALGGRGRLPDAVSEPFDLPLLPARHRAAGKRAAALRLLERQLLNAAKKRDISHEISLCHFLFYFST